MKPIQEIAYAKYQLDWMIQHGYSLQDLMYELCEYQYADPEDSDAISNPVTEIFDGWEEESGFHGELWVCPSEFLGAEYLDNDYMKCLLTDDEYTAYQKDVAGLKGGA